MKGLFILLVIGVVAAGLYYAPVHHRAKTGSYYLSDYISFVTPGGVVGWTPGQEVSEVIKSPFVEGSRTVTDGAYTALIPETVLTQDMEDSDAMQLADNASQGQARDKIAADRAHYDGVQHTAMVSAAQDITRANAQQVLASRVGLYATRLNEPVRRMGGGGYAVYYGVPVRGQTAPTTTANNSVTVSPLAAQAGSLSYAPFDHHVGPSQSPTPYPSGVAR